MSQTLFTMVKTIAKEIDKKGGTVYLVGGLVRDSFIGEPNHDIDVEIHNISFSEVKHILSAFGEVDLIGSSFGILKIKGIDIDFAFPRTENNTGKNHTDFEVSIDPFMGTTQAAKRRDFTMNAIMKNILTNEVIDPFNGVADIASKTIRYVNADTFIEDPLRVLRAAQFASRFNFDIDPAIFNLAKTLDYTNLSRERISTELDKVLMGKHPKIGLQFLKDVGVFYQILPHLIDGNFERKLQAIENANEFTFNFGILFAHLSPEALKEVTELYHSNRITLLLNESNAYLEQIPELPLMTEKERKILFFNTTNFLWLFNVSRFLGELDPHIDRISLIENHEIERQVLGRHLIAVGFHPGKNFKSLLDRALDLQFDGLTREQILTTLVAENQ